jgi:hypothetical protein
LLPLEGERVMKRSHSRPLARYGAGVFFLLMLQILAAPSAAWAGCGHLERAQPHTARNLFQLDAIFTAGTSVGLGDELAGIPSPGRPSPCSGMSCSSRDSLPISTSSLVVRSPNQQVCALVTTVDLAAMPLSRLVVDEQSSATVHGEKTSVFHPPRP